MKDCPGGCAIWGVTCAPSTYKELCEHAKNQGRDVMRKYVFYIFLGVFAMGTMYICCSSDDNAQSRSNYEDDLDDKYQRVTEEKE